MKKIALLLLSLLLLFSCAHAESLMPEDGIVPLVNGASLDLDEDGTLETVTWQLDVDEYDYGAMLLSVNGATLRIPVEYGYDAVYAGRLNNVWDNIYLLVGDFGMSDDPCTSIVRYHYGTLTLIGTIAARPENIAVSETHLTASVRARTLQTWRRETDFVLVQSPSCEWSVCESPRTSYTLATGVTLLDNVTLRVSLYGADTFTLPSGTNAAITASDDLSWIYLAVTGQNDTPYAGGYLMLSPDGFGVMQNGAAVPGYRLLDGLLFAD